MANWFLWKPMTAALGARIHLRDTGLPAQPLDLHHVEQVIDLLGQLAEAVDQLGGERIDFARASPASTGAGRARA